MAIRRKSKITTIKCATELATIRRIVEASGLIAEPAGPDLFDVANSGRILASELRYVLWADATTKLDQAVKEGAIPQWSKVGTSDHAIHAALMTTAVLVAIGS